MIFKTDFLIIGNGIAGSLLALEIASHGQVILLCKDDPQEGNNTYYAQGGIAAVLPGNDDTAEKHMADTLMAGDGLCDKNAVSQMVQSAPQIIETLLKYGVVFEKSNCHFKLGREGAHSEKRILFYKDMTGKEIQSKLLSRVKAHPNILFLPYHFAIDLLMERKMSSTPSEGKRCWGAYVYNKTNNEVFAIGAKKTFLASGGAGKIYLYTSNPDTATGDGIAMAYRAGAVIRSMEFMQFHPTTLYHPYAKNFLISEAVRGEGAILKDGQGCPFMEKYHELKSLAPRDIVARAMDNEMKRSGDDHLYLDISMKPRAFIKERFPNIYEKCLSFNIDITRDMIPVVPAAHYTCGGIKADLNGTTGIENLYALGETACTGFHGANRLASNSLLEGAGMALLAAQKIAIEELADSIPDIDPWKSPTTPRHENVFINHNWDELRRTMWNFVGIVRSEKRLEAALKRIMMIREEIRDFYYANPLSVNLIELRNIIINALITVKAAQWRKESRGIHYMMDYPEKSDHYKNRYSDLTKKELE